MMPRHSPDTRRRDLAIGGIFLVLAVVTRLPVLSRSVLDWDESLYLLIAGQWRAGHLPYTTVWDNKPVGIYALFAVFETLPVPPVVAMRIAGMVCAGVSAWLVHVVIRGFGGGRGPALFGGAAFLVASLGNDGLAANTEPFMACCTLAAVAIAGGAGRRVGVARAFAAGLAAGCAFMIKYVSVLETPALLLLVLRGATRRRDRVAPAAAFAAGAALPLLATMLLYWRAGALPLWWSCAIDANFRRAGAVLPPGALAYAARIEILRWGPLYLAGAAVLAAGAGRWWRRAWRDDTLFLALWLAGGCLGVAAARSFYDHYFLQILPALCVCLGWCAARLGRRRILAGALGLAALAPPAFAARAALREATGPDVSAAIANDLAGPLAARPGGIYVFDGQPILYVLTAETPPTRYAFPSVLTTRFLAHVAGVDAPAEVARILARRPLFIVRRPRPPRGDNPLNGEVYALMAAGLAADYRLWRHYPGADVYERR